MSVRLQLDRSLIRRYDVPGPRYTSYPTPGQFVDVASAPHLLDDVRSGGRTPRPLALYVHIPFCETLCWFCGCTTVTTRNHDRADRYLEYVAREIALTVPRLQPECRVRQIHLGGGTPSFLRPEGIHRLGRMLHDHFAIEPDAEISVELDPRRLTQEHVAAFRALGATRASFGIQDFDPAVQRAVNRIQPKALSDRAAAWVRALGYESLNLDLVYGLPHQTVESFARTLELALELAPDRLAVFSYAHVPWMKPGQRLVAAAGLPDAETKVAMLATAIELLTDRGYAYIGMDHFAAEHDELAVARRAGTLQRNFQGYSTRAGSDVCAFGMSAISQTPTHYRQNEKDLRAYYRRLDAGELPIARGCVLSDEDRIRRHVIMRLMCDGALDWDALAEQLRLDVRRHFAREIAALAGPARDGLVELHAHGMTTTDTGRVLVRNLAMVFDQYFVPAPERYSRTI